MAVVVATVTSANTQILAYDPLARLACVTSTGLGNQWGCPGEKTEIIWDYCIEM